MEKKRKRFVRCSLCGAKNIDHPERGYFFFPPNERGRQWADYTQLPHLINKPSSQLRHHRLCSQHFREEDVYNCLTRKYLRKNAVPSVPFSDSLIAHVMRERSSDAFESGTCLYSIEELSTESQNGEDAQEVSVANIENILSFEEVCVPSEPSSDLSDNGECVRELSLANVYTIGEVFLQPGSGLTRSNECVQQLPVTQIVSLEDFCISIENGETSSLENNCVQELPGTSVFTLEEVFVPSEVFASDAAESGEGRSEEITMLDVESTVDVPMNYEDHISKSIIISHCMATDGLSDSITSGFVDRTEDDVAFKEIAVQNAKKQTVKSSSANRRRKINQTQQKLIKMRRTRCCQSMLRSKIAVMRQIVEKLPIAIFDFVKMLLPFAVRKPQGRRWTSEDKSYAFGIYLRSPKAYRVLRKRLHLPSKKTLTRSIHAVGRDVGFCPLVSLVLSSIARRMNERDKYCVLTFDEVCIQPGLKFNVTLDKIVGFEDFGHDVQTRKRLANKALIFTACGVYRPWHQVVGYFFVHSSTSVSILKYLVVNAVEQLCHAGLEVVAVVCDQMPCNRAVYRALKCTPQKPYFETNSATVFVLFDPPSLLTRLRNSFFKYDIKFPEEGGAADGNSSTWRRAKWQSIVDLHSRESQAQRTCAKLTLDHVALSKSARRRNDAKMASQVFSKSVASALWMHAVYTGDETARDTADLCSEVDEMFDSVSDRTVNYCSKARSVDPVKFDSSHSDVWWRKSNLMASLVFEGNDGQSVAVPSCVYGWQLTLSAFAHLWRDLQRRGLKVLHPSRLNLDRLRQTLATLRSSRRRPSVGHFESAIVGIMARNLTTPHFLPQSCQDVFDRALLQEAMQDRNALKAMFRSCPLPDVETVPVEMSQALATLHNEKWIFCNSNNAVEVAAYLITVARRNNFCDDCLDMLETKGNCTGDALKLNRCRVDARRVLPCHRFVSVVGQMCVQFDKYFSLICSQTLISQHMYTIISEKVSFHSLQLPHDCHVESIKIFIVKLLVLVMLSNKLREEKTRSR